MPRLRRYPECVFSDPDEVRDCMERLLHRRMAVLECGKGFRLTTHAAPLPLFSLNSLVGTAGITTTTGNLDCCTLTRMEEGVIVRESDRGRVVCKPGQGLFAPANSTAIHSLPGPFKTIALAIPVQHLQDVAESLFGLKPEQPFVIYSGVNLSSASELGRWLDFILKELECCHNVQEAHSQYFEDSQRRFLRTLLETTPNNWQRFYRRRTGRSAELHVNAMEDYIATHIEDPALDVKHIAAALGICERTLRKSCESLGLLNPKAILSERQKNWALRESENPQNLEVTVTSLVRELGHMNVGRYSSFIKQETGESLKARLARGKRKLAAQKFKEGSPPPGSES